MSAYDPADAGLSGPLDTLDRRLLDAIQRAVPLDRRPFAALAESLGNNEADVMARLRRIRSLDMVSRISGVFDTRSLGYDSVLVAARYAPERVDAGAAIVSEYPGVSHNYLRDAEYNLWFTLAVPPDSRLGLDGVAARLASLSGAQAYRLLPATRVFKIGVRLAMADDEAMSPSPDEPAPSASPRTEPPAAQAGATAAELRDGPARTNRGADGSLSPSEKAAILALQQDLPIEPTPFDRLAAAQGLDVDAVLSAGRDFLAKGLLRRYAAVLRHRNVGYTVNCMTVWSVSADDAERVGAVLAGFAEVTHCYLRPTWPDWPYNLYAMVHCRSEQQCRDLLDRMRVETGISDMQGLFTRKEYKKVRLQYFDPAFEEWERRHR